MAIAFNLPSERPAAEESYSRLNRLLAELYDVLCHILVTRQSEAPAGLSAPPAPPPSRDSPRERPFSDSDIDRPGISGLLPDVILPQSRRPRSVNPLTLPILPDISDDLDDEVFISPRMDNGNDPFSNPRNVEIFGSPRNGSPRTPAGVLLSPRGRLDKRFTFSGTSEKHWKDKGGTVDDTDETGIRSKSSDELDSAQLPDSEGSLLTSILPDKLSGSICTALLFMLGWKFLTGKR